MKKLLALGMILFAFAILATGCGSSNSSDSESEFPSAVGTTGGHLQSCVDVWNAAVDNGEDMKGMSLSDLNIVSVTVGITSDFNYTGNTGQSCVVHDETYFGGGSFMDLAYDAVDGVFIVRGGSWDNGGSSGQPMPLDDSAPAAFDPSGHLSLR